MTTIGEISKALRAAVSAQGITQAQLRLDAGVAGRTLTRALSGEEDFKLSTLLALADRLGLDLQLGPRAAAAPGHAAEPAPPAVLSRVQAALQSESP